MSVGSPSVVEEGCGSQHGADRRLSLDPSNSDVKSSIRQVEGTIHRGKERKKTRTRRDWTVWKADDGASKAGSSKGARAKQDGVRDRAAWKGSGRWKTRLLM